MWLPWRRRRRDMHQPVPEPADDHGMPAHGVPERPRCRWCNTTKWRFHGVLLCPYCDHPKPKETTP